MSTLLPVWYLAGANDLCMGSHCKGNLYIPTIRSNQETKKGIVLCRKHVSIQITWFIKQSSILQAMNNKVRSTRLHQTKRCS